ncbi:hypothetical protein AAHS21_31400 [Mycobacterium sp. 050272]|uniref:hypothetical protein n=1 Tax=Mycobacterium sp. 050272 TaxID=3142488 RepID=UPI00318BE9E8
MHGAVLAAADANPPGVHWGDVPAWVTASVAALALIISCCSAVLAWKSLRWERVSAEAATRSAEAAERANRLAEMAVLQRVQLSGIPSEEAFGEPTVEAAPVPDVSWRIEKPGGDRYILRNTGTDVAEHVEVDATQVGPIHRNLPQDAVIRPGEGVDMLIKGTWGHPMPNQLYVRWAGQPDWVAIPIT